MYVAESNYANMLAALFQYPRHSPNRYIHHVRLMDEPIAEVSHAPELLPTPTSSTEGVPSVAIFNPALLQKCHAVFADAKTVTYTCLRSETCCNTGCCTSVYRKLTQFWYFWFLLTIAAAILLGCFHFYKKQRIREQQHLRNACRRSTASRQQQRLLAHRLLMDASTRSTRSGVQHQLAAFNDAEFEYFLQHYSRHALEPQQVGEHANQNQLNEHILGHLFPILHPRPATPPQRQNLNMNLNTLYLHNVSNPPPSYETLVDLDSSNKDNEETIKQEEEPPPVYLEACKMEIDANQAQEPTTPTQDTNNNYTNV